MQILFSIRFHNRPYFPLPTILISHIAVLVAIAIPIFTSQLEKSRDATSVSNMRAAYAEASTEYLTWDGGTYTQQPGSSVKSISEASGVVTITVEKVSTKTKDDNGWSGLSGELPFTVFEDPGTPVTNGTATFTYTVSSGAWELTGISGS